MNHHPIDPVDVAWRLVDILQEMSNQLWQAFEQPFAERCCLEFQEPPEPPEEDDIDDEIPF